MSVQLYPDVLSQEQVEVFYYQHKKKGDAYLVFESFLKALLNIAKVIFQKEESFEALNNLYILYFKTQADNSPDLIH